MFGAVLFAAAGNSGYAGYESGNMWESLSDVFSQYGIVSYAAETSSVDLSQIKKVEYGNLRELIKAGNFSYLQSDMISHFRITAIGTIPDGEVFNI